MSAPAIASAGFDPLFANVSLIAFTVRPGANRAVSASQLPTTLVGATTRKGAAPGASPAPASPAASFAASLAAQISASAWTVLPRPMSSASTPPRPCRKRKLSQLNPSSWYGRSSALSVAGRGRPLTPPSKSPPTASRHAAACSSTIPSWASSSQSPAWKRLICSGASLLSCSERASSMSARSWCSSGRSSEKYAPLGSSMRVWPAARAENRAAKDTGWPSRVMTMPRSNQSRLSVALVEIATTGASSASR